MAFHAERAALLSLLAQQGILRSTEEQPIRWPDGSAARWMLDSLPVTLTPRGAELAGRCLLELLRRFESRQLATYGTTGIPLLQTCILQGGGDYRGLIVRKEPKRGSGRRIDGDIDLDQPVIIVDDSLASGQAMLECAAQLRQAGLRVEGGVCLVRFGGSGGWFRLREQGLHIEYVFDALRDLAPLVDGPEAILPANPSKIGPAITWSGEWAPEGMHPALLARLVIEQVLDEKPVPRPPTTLDRSYDGRGGTWVSVRPTINILLRHAREGFWHLPGEQPGPLPEELIVSAVRTALRMKSLLAPRELLRTSGVAVTFFGPLAECTVGQIDNSRYGILVCSRERPGRWGGALPRMPGFYREWAQLEHARKNAQLLPREPYVLYRHTVDKVVEPGILWQPTGVPVSDTQPGWYADRERGGRLALRALDLLRARLTAQPEVTAALPDAFLPELDMLFVTLFVDGKVAGCMGTKVQRLDEDLRRSAEQALLDSRFGNKPSAERINGLAVSVSLLHHPMSLGVQTPAEIAVRVRLDEQVLLVFQGARHGLILPWAVVQQSLSREQYVAEVIDKAGITRPPYSWGSYECHSWLADGSSVRRMKPGLPEGTPPATLDAALAALGPQLLGYLLRHQRDDGLRVGHYRPLLDQESDTLELPRQIHGSFVLARAHRVLGDERLKEAARRGIDTLIQQTVRNEADEVWLSGAQPSIAEVSFLLLSLCELERAETDPLAQGLAKTLILRIDRHGFIATRPPGASAANEPADPHQDYLPAQALLALAVAHERGKISAPRAVIERALGYYRHRFRYVPHFGQVAWLSQSAAAWWRQWRDATTAALVFEVIDWALEYQQEKSGGFINDQQPDSPGYTTAVYLEGVAAALGVAMACSDDARTSRYRAACEHGLRFLDALIYQERDRAVVPNIERARGGLRLSHTASDVRIDFVQHALSAILELNALRQKPPLG